MITITADRPLQELLSSLKEEAIIRDASGNILGYFAPREQLEAKLYEKARAMMDPVEIKRRKEAEHGKGYTIEQVMEHLKSLETTG